MPKIFVAGSFVVGITIGVPRMPVPGEGLIGDTFDIGPGGKGTNQAVAAARLGAEVGLLAGVGDDLLSSVAFDLYEREGISLEHIHRISGANTGVGCVTLLPSGEQCIVGYLGANTLLGPEYVEAARKEIADSDILLTQYELPVEAVARALEIGREAGAMTIWNPAPAKEVPPEIFRNVDLLTPNESEARILLGLPPDDPTPTIDLAAKLMGLGVGQVVITCGKEGAIIVTHQGHDVVSPVRGIKAVDATGAGDCFNAGLAVSLGEGMSLRDAVRWASFCGAYAVTRLGVIDGLPTRAELDSFVQAHSGPL